MAKSRSSWASLWPGSGWKADGGAGVADEIGGDGGAGQIEGAPGSVVEHELAGQVPEADGEQRRREVAGEAGVEAERRRRRAPEVHLEVGLEERAEEAQADD